MKNEIYIIYLDIIAWILCNLDAKIIFWD